MTGSHPSCPVSGGNGAVCNECRERFRLARNVAADDLSSSVVGLEGAGADALALAIFYCHFWWMVIYMTSRASRYPGWKLHGQFKVL